VGELCGDTNEGGVVEGVWVETDDYIGTLVFEFGC